MITESKAERLAATLQQFLTGNDVEVGTFLGTKAQLQARHEVAAGTLNEAVRLLQVRGYVDVRPGPRGGLFAANKAKRNELTDTLLEAQEDPTRSATLIALQDALEVLVVVTAAQKCTAEDATQIEDCLGELDRATDERGVMRAIWNVDRAIARATRNNTLSSVYCGLLDALEEATRWSDLHEMVTRDTISVHKSIATAVMANEVEAARRAAHLHSPSLANSRLSQL